MSNHSSSPKVDRPRVAITMGDPAGVGPEICLKLLANPEFQPLCTPIVFGDAEVLREVASQIQIPFSAPVIFDRDQAHSFDRIDAPSVLHIDAIRLDEVKPGVMSAATGRASFAYVQRAIDAVLAKSVAAVTTAPLSKEALHLAGIHFPGHTEIFAERTGSTRSCMMQYSEKITCTFVTVHCGYRDVPGLLSKERILEVIELSAEALQRIRCRRPKIVVCGLNPHAGEHGLFGDREEERLIEPAIEEARRRGFDVEGPLPPDTAFIPARRAMTDVFVCMYHDQGHIPVKALAFDSAVNTTLGLPVVRTSVDHGTAWDIAWKNLADPSSLFAAVRLAVKLGGNERNEHR